MKLCVTTMGSDPYRVRKRIFPLNFGNREEMRHWYVGVNPHPHFKRLLPTTQPMHEFDYCGIHYMLSVPSAATMHTNVAQFKSGSATSAAEYFAHQDEIIAGTHYGWLLQLLEAHPRHHPQGSFSKRREWPHESNSRKPWAFTSLHYHVGDGNGYPGPTEWFYPIFGSCEMFRGTWERLIRPTAVAPGIAHQLRSRSLAINLLIMCDIRDPAGVRSTANHCYCRFGTHSV